MSCIWCTAVYWSKIYVSYWYFCYMFSSLTNLLFWSHSGLEWVFINRTSSDNWNRFLQARCPLCCPTSSDKKIWSCGCGTDQWMTFFLSTSWFVHVRTLYPLCQSFDASTHALEIPIYVPVDISSFSSSYTWECAMLFLQMRNVDIQSILGPRQLLLMDIFDLLLVFVNKLNTWRERDPPLEFHNYELTSVPIVDFMSRKSCFAFSCTSAYI